MADARSLGAAARAGTLRGWHHQRIVDATEVLRRRDAIRRLARRLGRDLAEITIRVLVDSGGRAQLRVGVVELVGAFGVIAIDLWLALAALNRVDEKHELGLADLLARLESSRDPREPPRHVRVLGDQLAHELEDRLAVVLREQRAYDVEHRAAQIARRRFRGNIARRRRASILGLSQRPPANVLEQTYHLLTFDDHPNWTAGDYAVNVGAAIGDGILRAPTSFAGGLVSDLGQSCTLCPVAGISRRDNALVRFGDGMASYDPGQEGRETFGGTTVVENSGSFHEFFSLLGEIGVASLVGGPRSVGASTSPDVSVFREASTSAGAGGSWSTIGERAGGAIAQTNDVSCGAACGEMLSSMPQSTLIASAGAPTSVGTLALALGAGWRGGYVGPTQLDKLFRLGRSFIAELYDGQKLGHFVVVDGLKGAQVLVRDPAGAGSVYRMLRSEFERFWTGNAVFK